MKSYNLNTPEEIHKFMMDYINSCDPENGHPLSPAPDMRNTMSDLLAGMMDSIRDNANLTKRWSDAGQFETAGKPEQGRSHFVECMMDKTGACCRLIFYAGSITIDFTLPHMTEIPSMDSKFWSRLSTVIERHKMTFAPNRWDTVTNSKADKTITRFTKSPLFSFFTLFHLAHRKHWTENPMEQIHYHGSEWANDIGTFEKSTLYQESSWPDIIACYSEIFAEFTKLSQDLYRSHYIKART